MTTEPQKVPIDHPGTFIAEELTERKWTQADLAYILGMDVTQLNKLINGKTDITPESAIALGDAFDMPAEFFMNLQNAFDLLKAKKADPGVSKRARLAAFPIREMIKRKWIEDGDTALLDLQMMRFFDKPSVEEIPFIGNAPILSYAAKKGTDYEETTPAQYAWLHRVRKIAEHMDAPLYSETALRNKLSSIRSHMLDLDDLIHIPTILNKCGVRFVLVESLPGSKIDGVCVWLDGQPVIGMTMRLNRPDDFCFVLRHEIEHVLRGDGREATFAPIDVLDADGLSKPLPECEMIANEVAGEFCVPRALLDSFLARKGSFITERDLLNFAARVQINPAVVVGQIQYRTNKYGVLRKFQVSIQERLLPWKYKDGWGHFAPTGTGL